MFLLKSSRSTLPPSKQRLPTTRASTRRLFVAFVDICVDFSFSPRSLLIGQAQDQHDLARWAEQLASLKDMGFTDTEELLPLLRKFNGVVPRVVSELFARKQ
jgi:hypothetical protein